MLFSNQSTTKFELPELPGYEDSKPVRVGNAASEQFQLDVYGEIMGVAWIGLEALGRIEHRFWPRWRTVGEHVETIWREPDDGIWETRGERQHFTYSKVMAWVVFDRAVRIAERLELEAPLERRKQIRDEIHHEVCERRSGRDGFVSRYSTTETDDGLPGDEGRQVGYFPQAFGHLTSIVAARAISAAQEAARSD